MHNPVVTNEPDDPELYGDDPDVGHDQDVFDAVVMENHLFPDV